MRVACDVPELSNPIAHAQRAATALAGVSQTRRDETRREHFDGTWREHVDGAACSRSDVPTAVHLRTVNGTHRSTARHQAAVGSDPVPTSPRVRPDLTNEKIKMVRVKWI